MEGSDKHTTHKGGVSGESSEQASNEEAYLQTLKEGVVPDVLDRIEDNVLKISLQYGEGESSIVTIGDELYPNLTKTSPSINWVGESGKYYTLLMTDPDAPSREDPKFAEWQHWLVVNIPGNEVDKGQTLTEYIGPKPPKNTGLHRYIFLVFEQPQGKTKYEEPYKSDKDLDNRPNFNTREFVKKYHLRNPTAGIFYKAQWDNSVG